MSDFVKFRDAVNENIADMTSYHNIYCVCIDPDALWELYLESFPAGTNPMFRERTEHDCSCCKQFIRSIGDMVAVVNGGLVSVWDIDVGGIYQVVADALSKAVKEQYIDTIWLTDQKTVGTKENHEEMENGSVTKWEHFYAEIPKKLHVKDGSIAAKAGQARTNFNVLQRSLQEISPDSINIVLELISQNSLYRGEEHKSTLTTLKRIQEEYVDLDNKEIFLWETSKELGRVSAFRNTVIGTLLVDISEDMDLDAAVNRFTDKVAPQNYKRPSSVVTQSMIKKAQAKVEELGLKDSLQRRYAKLDDITINNVLFADRSIKNQLRGVFDELSEEVQTKLPNLDKVEEISIDKFISQVVPNASSIEVLFENKHASNLVSLIAPTNTDAPNILKWGNNFSWSYAGEVTDSVKERVKSAGGNVDGDVRVSLSWFNYDDLDISVTEPSGYHIYYCNRTQLSPSGGQLDVDMNVNSGGSREPVENITYQNINSLREGNYKVQVHNFTKRESIDTGFSIEMEVLGDLYEMEFDRPLRNNERVTVVEFSYSRNEGIKLLSTLKANPVTKTHWGIPTNQFHKVDSMMFSPNHWDGEETGNKHIFFMLNGCANPEQSRGLYNEFLRPDLNDHRKVFEVLGGKLKTPESTDQLSGLGFSTTQQNHVICRVTGSFNRVVKVVF